MNLKTEAALVALVASFMATAHLDAQTLDGIPPLRGEFTYVHGTFFGYVPPSEGDSTYFDCSALDSISSLRSFGPGGPGFIPMFDSLHVQRHDSGAMEQAWRLKSEGPSGHITIDLRLHGDPPERAGTVWIVTKDPYVSSVARIAVEEIESAEGIEFGGISFGIGVGSRAESDSAAIRDLESIANRFESEAASMAVVGRALTPAEQDRINRLIRAAEQIRSAIRAFGTTDTMRIPTPSE